MPELDNEGLPVSMTRPRTNDAAWYRLRDQVIKEEQICHICLELVDKDAKAPDALSPSVDHLIPWSLGGTNTRANTRLAHLGCNKARYNKPLDDVKATRNSRIW